MRPRLRQARRVRLVESEASYQRRLVEAMGWLGWILIYHTQNSRHSPAGFPDLVAVRPPRVLFVEVKTDIGVVRPEQKAWGWALSHCPGVEYYVWRPRDWPSVESILRRAA